MKQGTGPRRRMKLFPGSPWFHPNSCTIAVYSSHSCSSPEKSLDECGSEVTPEEVCWLGGPVTLGHIFKGLQISTGWDFFSKALRHLFHLEINSLPQLQPVKKVKWELAEKSLPLLYECAEEKSMALVLPTSPCLSPEVRLMLQKVHSWVAGEPLCANVTISAKSFCWASHVWVPPALGTRERGQHGILSVGSVMMWVVLTGQTGQTHWQNPCWVMHAVSPRQASAHRVASECLLWGQSGLTVHL